MAGWPGGPKGAISAATALWTERSMRGGGEWAREHSDKLACGDAAASQVGSPSANWTAASAWRAVVSKSGTGLSVAVTRSINSVQPRMTASAPRSTRRGDDLAAGLFRVGFDAASDEFFVDDAMDHGAVGGCRGRECRGRGVRSGGAL